MAPAGIVSVEDNKMDALVIKRTLGTLTCEDVTILATGKEALAFFSDKKNVPRLILLDINLPHYTGLEILKRIRTLDHLRGTPIIMFSSSQIDEEIHLSYWLGANSYVAKPSSHTELETAITTIYEYWYRTARIVGC